MIEINLIKNRKPPSFLDQLVARLKRDFNSLAKGFADYVSKFQTSSKPEYPRYQINLLSKRVLEKPRKNSVSFREKLASYFPETYSSLTQTYPRYRINLLSDEVLKNVRDKAKPIREPPKPAVSRSYSPRLQINLLSDSLLERMENGEQFPTKYLQTADVEDHDVDFAADEPHVPGSKRIEMNLLPGSSRLDKPRAYAGVLDSISDFLK